MSNVKCPICKSSAIEKQDAFDDQKLECTRCGNYSISRTASVTWQAGQYNSRQIANASGWIREHQDIIINSNNIEFLSSVLIPSVAGRADKVLNAIAKHNLELSDHFRFSYISNIDLWLGISYSDNHLEINYLFHTYLKNELNYIDFIDTQYSEGFVFNNIYITPKGYAYLDSLQRNSTNSKIGFCAMWFDAKVLPIWTDAIQPAIKATGYDAKRIDGHAHNNRIDDEIIAMLRRSKFVVADFTGQRGGVYFEAGFALGSGLQVIWTCKKSDLKDVHFDNRQYNFVTWEEDKLDEFKVSLQNRIEATIGLRTMLLKLN